MRTSDAGLKKIADFEGCVLHAYKPVAAEPFYTIGYGHYGADVSPNMTITQEQALEIFRHDITRFETYVKNTGLNLTQNQFDALVSFAYNCGGGSLQKLVANRTYQQIADALLLWNKDCTGKILPGLVKRRQWEHDLFMSDVTPTNGCPYPTPTKNLHKNSRGNDVRWLQYMLTKCGYHLVCDGIFGDKTDEIVRAFQADNPPLVIDGIVGPATRAKLEEK
jgi:GH24 family phage-related lysozyme (muramidase)